MLAPAQCLVHISGMTEANQPNEFPLYKMMIDDQEHWLPLYRAGVAYDSGWVSVSIGGLVLESAGQAREITDQERAQIADIADEYSANK